MTGLMTVGLIALYLGSLALGAIISIGETEMETQEKKDKIKSTTGFDIDR